MGNITETGHFEKLAELENRLEEIDTDIDIQWALRCIDDDHLEGWDGTEEEKLESAKKLIEERELMKLEEELDQEALEWERKDSEEERDSEEIERGMEKIRNLIANKGIVNIDHDDLRDILDITVTCLEAE